MTVAEHATIDPAVVFPRAGRWRRFVRRFRRMHRPIVRYWSAEFHYVATDPDNHGQLETWPQWWRRQYRRVFRRYTSRRW